MVTARDLEPDNNDGLVTNENVHDDTETDDVTETVRYRITSYGADFDIEGLVRRTSCGDIFVPDFQRGYVWQHKQASQFVESLLQGLPVPGIFLTQEPDTEKLMVIDGQQRLKTMQFFYSGAFPEGALDVNGERPFALQGVDQAFEGKKYVDLREPDRRRLDDTLIHATIIRQLFPEEGLSSVFHIFQRLNSTGQRLVPQEIRQAIYRGDLLDSIKGMNANTDWRAIFGSKHRRQKDQELILRFWAMYLNAEHYEAPMLGFLNTFAEGNRNPDIEFLHDGMESFAQTMRIFYGALQRQAFRTEGSRQLNAAVFDSMSVGLARRIKNDTIPEPDAVARAYRSLLADTDYLASVSGGTAQAASVKTRIDKALQTFGKI